MKKKYLIANWKMQLNKSDSVRLAVEIVKEYKEPKKNLEIVLAPTFIAISSVKRKLKNSIIKLSAQNVFYHEKGSYTGEVSPLHLKELGVEYVIIGHSERRQYLKETNEEINRKINIVLDNDLTPIVCVGETMEERQDNKTDLTLIKQISKAMEDIKLKENQKIIIAYEPVWVIGTGQAVDPKEAKHAVEVIKYNLREYFNEETIKNNIYIIYGGSVDENNVNEFLKIDLIQGALVGGASLNINKFISIIRKIK